MTDVQQALAVMDEVNKVILGKEECIRKVMAAILGGGHVLLEDVPGVGKTKMTLAFARAMRLHQKRVQFTPDVLPADITGFSMYHRETGKFVYQPGAAMCNLLLADEINRTSPKTQSALLEVMEEEQVTVDGVTRSVPSPFVVLATENPMGSHGTQMLPQSQMDRFMICISMGYPTPAAEIQLLKDRHGQEPLDGVKAVMGGEDLLRIRRKVEEIFIHDAVYEYMVEIAKATREHPVLELGLSPRGTLALCNMAKALAYLEGREYVLPRDVQEALWDVAPHRMVLNGRARVSHRGTRQIVEEVLTRVAPPVPDSKSGRRL